MWSHRCTVVLEREVFFGHRAGGLDPPRYLPIHAPLGRCTASKDQLVDRLARVEGQVRGVTRVVEDDRYCLDVLTQISAAQAALDKIALGLLDDHTRNCVLAGEGGAPTDPDARADEIMADVGRMLARRASPGSAAGQAAGR